MIMPVLFTKLISPQINPQIIKRLDLLRSLRKNLDKKATIITANGGYGKSTLAALFIDQYKIPYVWYNLNENDNDPFNFLTHIAHGVKKQFGDIVDEAMGMIEEGCVEWDLLMTALFNEIVAGVNEKFVLVLDGFHFVESYQGMKEMLFSFIRYCPPNIHIIILSRERPGIPLNKLKFNGGLAEFGPNDISFDINDMNDLFRDIYNVDLNFHDLKRAHEYSEGWVLMLRLIGESINLEAGNMPASFEFNINSAKEEVFQYFNDEVFCLFDEDQRMFLKETSIMNYFNSLIYDFLKNGSGSEQIVKELLRKQAFVVKLDNEGEWYRYHRCFRDFLIDRLELEETPDHIRELHKRAALYFKEYGDGEGVVYHSINAQDYSFADEEINDAINFYVEI